MKNEKEMGITYVVMPVELLQNKDLTPAEKILYCYLTVFKKQCCFQSNDAISEATGIEVRSIQRGLKKLAEMNYIFIEFVNNNSAMRRIYTIIDNPKKLEYLAKKGMFGKMPKPVEAQAEEDDEPAETVATASYIPNKPLNVGRPARSEYASDEEYEKAFYEWNRVVV